MSEPTRCTPPALPSGAVPSVDVVVSQHVRSYDEGSIVRYCKRGIQNIQMFLMFGVNFITISVCTANSTKVNNRKSSATVADGPGRVSTVTDGSQVATARSGGQTVRAKSIFGLYLLDNSILISL